MADLASHVPGRASFLVDHGFLCLGEHGGGDRLSASWRRCLVTLAVLVTLVAEDVMPARGRRRLAEERLHVRPAPLPRGASSRCGRKTTNDSGRMRCCLVPRLDRRLLERFRQRRVTERVLATATVLGDEVIVAFYAFLVVCGNALTSVAGGGSFDIVFREAVVATFCAVVIFHLSLAAARRFVRPAAQSVLCRCPTPRTSLGARVLVRVPFIMSSKNLCLAGREAYMGTNTDRRPMSFFGAKEQRERSLLFALGCSFLLTFLRPLETARTRGPIVASRPRSLRLLSRNAFNVLGPRKKGFWYHWRFSWSECCMEPNFLQSSQDAIVRLDLTIESERNIRSDIPKHVLEPTVLRARMLALMLLMMIPYAFGIHYSIGPRSCGMHSE
ncbi:hypothetical protein HPB50_027418 [Hyalomma asiaticum]|uniref:Uncharacterized protein n=1 Tax=Hyalomma asiaticum TaxID=266040 RepID=A0ACB7SKX5_HYAAI|nr:hypothetical protein HPB50_027418 [Hyalomma asiaticum]